MSVEVEAVVISNGSCDVRSDMWRRNKLVKDEVVTHKHSFQNFYATSSNILVKKNVKRC